MTVVIYPAVIARACSALDESPIFHSMPDGYLRVVIRIVKKINIAKLAAPIVASRGTLARESGKSEETVGRVVRWLEEQGLIHREQKARKGLRGSSSPLVPTTKLLDALLLLEHFKAPADSAGDVPEQPRPQPPAPKMRPVAQTPSVQTRIGEFVKIGDVTLPADLVWLTEQGIKETAVLKLMRLAKSMRHRLSDIVTATEKYLRPLQGAHLYAYIKKLINKGTNYSSRASDTLKELHDKALKERIAHKAADLEGRRFRSTNGRVYVEVSKNGMLIEIRDGKRGARPMGIEFLQALEDQRLVPVTTSVMM